MVCCGCRIGFYFFALLILLTKRCSVYGFNETFDSAHFVYVHGAIPRMGHRLSELQNADLMSTCGRITELPRRKIAYGQLVRTSRHPWSVLFAYSNNVYCSGTLITDRHVLSAAHCFFFYHENVIPCKNGRISSSRIRQTKVMYGGVCMKSSDACEQTDMLVGKIKRVVLPIGFNEGRCLNGDDYAIVELQEPIQLSPYASPICIRRIVPSELLRKKGKKVYGQATHSGWGRTETGKRSVELRYFNATWLDVRGYIIYSSANKKGQTCVGDSGGTLEVTDLRDHRAVLAGITSTGPPCKLSIDDRSINVFVPVIIDTICYFTGVCPPE